jgi:hypothetical protein
VPAMELGEQSEVRFRALEPEKLDVEIDVDVGDVPGIGEGVIVPRVMRPA